MQYFSSRDTPPKQKPSAETPTTSKDPQIEVIEVYLEKSRALGLGQRLLWHMDKFNKRLTLPYIPADSKDLYLQPLSVKLKGSISDTKQCQNMLYTEQSNTVFYYNDYKVLLLLDFSQSTSSVYPGQQKSYFDKMRESLEVIIKNLLFQIKNQFHKKDTDEPVNKKETPKTQKLQSNTFDLSNQVQSSARDSDSESDAQRYNRDSSMFAIGEQSESGTYREESTPLVQTEDAKLEDQLAQSILQNRCSKLQQKEPRSAYSPKVYLSIVVSGLPPGNNLHLIIHNQKVDQRDLSELLKSIDKRLLNYQNQLRKNIQQKKTEDTIQGALQAHLQNAQYCLDLMSQDAKPLLVFFTDCANTLIPQTQQRGGMLLDVNFGHIDKVIHKLHLSDTKIISIDLMNENKTCNTLGYINHENELLYLTQITQGVNLTYDQLMAIDRKMCQEQKVSKKEDQFSYAALFSKEGTIRFSQDDGCLMIVNSLEANKTIVEQDSHPSGSRTTFTFGEKRSNLQQAEINTLQKVMFARPCNNRLFMGLDEIAQLIQTRPQVEPPTQKYFSDLLLPQLLFQGQVVPLMQQEHLAEYYLEKVGFASLIEFRSKMGFKLFSIKFHEIQHNQRYLGATPIEQEPSAIEQVIFTYLIDTQISLQCTLRPYRSAVTVHYDVNAPASTLRSLHSNSGQNLLRESLRSFVKSVQQRDQHFQLLESIVEMIRKAQIVLQNPLPPKYKEQNKKAPSRLMDIGNNQDQAEPKKKKAKVILSEDEARQSLLDNKKLWEQLTSMIQTDSQMYQWKCFFRYHMVTIMTQSASVATSFQLNRSPAEPEFWQRSITDEWQIEQQIEETLIEEISNFTTFTLDNTNFVQVFEDNSAINQYKLLDYSSLHKKDGDHQQQGERGDYGFCLIRLNMKATNVAECHFGFHQVGPKQRLNFIKAFKKYISSKSQKCLKMSHTSVKCHEQHSDQLKFKCFDKNIASILLQTPKRYRYSLQYLYKLTESNDNVQELLSSERQQQSDEEVPLHRLIYNYQTKPVELKQRRQQFLKAGLQSQQLFHKSEWKWVTPNAQTNRELFFRVLEQRLADGFQVVNRFQGTNEFFHLTKVLVATKDRSKEQVNKNGSRARSWHSDDGHREQREPKPEKIQIVIQFLVFIKETEQECSVNEELYMEQETSYFVLQKSPPQSQKSSHTQTLSSGSNESNNASNEVSCDQFFQQMSNFMQNVDRQMHIQIDTYHHIVKNSIHKQIQTSEVTLHQEASAIKEAVCYFKNLQAATKRQRRDRVYQICQKMQSLHTEWKQHLKTRYPELQVKAHLSTYFEVQQLIECSKLLDKQVLQVPKVEPFDQKTSKQLCEHFLANILKTLNDFTDMKLSVGLISDAKRESDVYIKLITKEHLLMVQLKAIREHRHKQDEVILLKDFEQNDRVQVEYFRFDPRMIRITQESLITSPIKRYFQTNGKQVVRSSTLQRNFKKSAIQMKHVRSTGILSNPTQIMGYQHDLMNLTGTKPAQQFLISQRGRTASSLTQDDRQAMWSAGRVRSYSSRVPEHEATQSVLEEDNYDEEINQIDEAEEILLYYQYHRPKATMRQSQLQFETKVNKIVGNFVSYLKQNFEKVFAESVLYGIREESNAQVVTKDFQRALEKMGQVTFQMDLSFSFLLQSLVDSAQQFSGQLKLIDQASNLLFSGVLNRNFVECAADPTCMIYRGNVGDGLEPNPQQVLNSTTYLSDFSTNLQGTPDAYSDGEADLLADEEESRPERAQRKFDYKEVYCICQNLIMKPELVIKNKKGKEIIRKPIKNYSDLYQLAKTQPNLAKALREKIKQNQPEEMEQNINFDQFENDSEQSGQSQDLIDTSASVEIWITFYTVPQYFGLLRACDVDFLQENTELLLNDDLMEDLQKVCQLMDPSQQDIAKQKVQTAGLLFNNFRRRQIVKLIPYFFQIDDDSQQVFYLEEIQRKLIYGVIRRLYALVGQHFMELLALHRPQADAPLVMNQVQKFFGYLLHNQRMHQRVHLFDKSFYVKRFADLQATLRQEIESGQIKQIGVCSSPDNPKQKLYFFKQTKADKHFQLKTTWQSADAAYLEQLNSYVIPFWAFFVVDESDKGLALQFTYHVPTYKQPDEPLKIQEYFAGLAEQLRVRVKKLVLLKEVSQKQKIAKELKLAPSFHLQSDLIEDQQPGDQSVDEIQVQAQQQQGRSRPTGSSRVSKFANKLKIFTTTSSNNNSVIAPAPRTESTSIIPSPVIRAPSMAQKIIQVQKEDSDAVTLETFPDSFETFATSHYLNVDQSLLAIQNSTAMFNFKIDGIPNVYVVKENDTVNIIKLSQYLHDQIIMEVQGVYPPSQLQVQRLSQCIKSIILESVQNSIADSSLKRQGLLVAEDFEYIRSSDEKILMMFPIPKCIGDKLALLKILSQTLTRKILIPVRIIQRVNQANDLFSSSLSVKSSFHINQTNSFQLKKPQDQSKLQQSTSFINNSTMPDLSPSAAVVDMSASQAFNPQKPQSQNDLMIEKFEDTDGKPIEEIKLPVQESHTYETKITQSDCTLLYNFNRPYDLETDEQSSKQNQSQLRSRQVDQKSKSRLSQFFGQALALVQISLRQKFMPDEFRAHLESTGQDEILEHQSRHNQDLFEVSPCLFNQRLVNECARYRQKNRAYFMSYSTSYNDLTSENLELINAPPLIFTTKKANNQLKLTEYTSLGGQQSFSYSQESQWLRMMVSVCVSPVSTFRRDDFIKQLVTDYNQALFDTLIEIRLYQPQPIQQITLKTSFAQLRSLFQRSLMMHSYSTSQQKFDCIGQALELNQQFSIKILKETHQLFFQEVHGHLKMFDVSMDDARKLVQAMWSFSLIIRHVEVGVVLKQVIVKLPFTQQLDARRVQEIIERFTRPEDTNLKNIQVRFEIIIGSFVYQTEPSHLIEIQDLTAVQTLEDNSPLQQQEENKDGLRVMDISFCNLQMKLFATEQTTIQLEGRADEATYMLHRNFCVIIDFSVDRGINLQAYNFSKLSQVKSIIQAALSDYDQCQVLHQKCLAERMGLMHSLPESSQAQSPDKVPSDLSISPVKASKKSKKKKKGKRRVTQVDQKMKDE